MRASLLLAICTATAIGVACSREPEVDKVPVGTDVQVVRQDGALVQGKLAARDEHSVKVDVGKTTRSVPREDIASVRVTPPVAPGAPAEPPARARFREITVPENTPLVVKLASSVGSATSSTEDPVTAEVVEPVSIDGIEVIPSGSTLRGDITEAQPSGKVKGRAVLGFAFNTMTIADERYPINARYAHTAESTKVEDAKKIGLPAAGGAVVGAIIGGKKGAAIGAAAGGGAGTAVVLNTRGRDIDMPAGTKLTLAIGRAIEVRVPIR